MNQSSFWGAQGILSSTSGPRLLENKTLYGQVSAYLDSASSIPAASNPRFVPPATSSEQEPPTRSLHTFKVWNS